MATDLLVLFLIFMASTLLSTYLMKRMGYGLPAGLNTRRDKLLVLMKILMFSMLSCIFLALFMLFGIDPLKLMPAS
jgi:hypothetical protein